MEQEDPTLSSLHPTERVGFLLTYQQHLIEGGTIRNQRVGPNTIDGYLRAAATVITEAGLPNPLFGLTKEAQRDGIRLKVYKDALHSYAKTKPIPRRMRAFTPRMLSVAKELAASAHFDTQQACLVDLLQLGLHTGFRVSEYAQASTKSITMAPRSDPPRPAAICQRDLRFLDRHQRLLRDPHAAQSRVHYVEITWFRQKNCQNGECIVFAKGSKELCPVSAALRLHARAARLAAPYGLLGYSLQGLITPSAMSRAIKQAATSALRLTSTTDIDRFNTHSLRVGACDLLNKASTPGYFIKQRLRWLSDAYETYLRNTVVAAEKHAKAVLEALESFDT